MVAPIEAAATLLAFSTAPCGCAVAIHWFAAVVILANLETAFVGSDADHRAHARRSNERKGGSVAWNQRSLWALKGMPHDNGNSARARAEALFKRREEQRADAPVAMAEYRAAQQVALDRMHELRRLRLAREARLARKG